MTVSRLLPDTPLMSVGLGRDLVVEIRRMILSGDFPAGERLMPQDLQDRFGVSVIPVREALRTLEAEGLITTAPRRGTLVSSLSVVELQDVYALRRMIEPPLAAKAAELRSSSDLNRAQQAFEIMEQTDGSQVEAWMHAHREFHWSLLDVRLGPVSARTIRQLWAVSERYVAMSLTAFRVDRPAQHDHKRLIDAFSSRDSAAVSVAWESHLHLVEEAILRDIGTLLD